MRGLGLDLCSFGSADDNVTAWTRRSVFGRSRQCQTSGKLCHSPQNGHRPVPVQRNHQQHAWAEAQTASAAAQDTERPPKATLGNRRGWVAGCHCSTAVAPRPVADKRWHPAPACSCLSWLVAEERARTCPALHSFCTESPSSDNMLSHRGQLMQE